MQPDAITELIAAAREAAIRFRTMMWLTQARKLEEAIAKVAGVHPEAPARTDAA